MAKTMARIEDGVVINLEWCADGTEETETLVNLDDYPVEIGDTFDGEYFYRDGVKVMTALESAVASIAEMREALALLGVVMPDQRAMEADQNE